MCVRVATLVGEVGQWGLSILKTFPPKNSRLCAEHPASCRAPSTFETRLKDLPGVGAVTPATLVARLLRGAGGARSVAVAKAT